MLISPRQSRGYDTSPLMRRKSYDRAYRYLHCHDCVSEAHLSFISPLCSFFLTLHPFIRPTDGYTPPSSPPLRTRNDRNVFSRLTSNQTQGSALDKWVLSLQLWSFLIYIYSWVQLHASWTSGSSLFRLFRRRLGIFLNQWALLMVSVPNLNSPGGI